MDRTKTLFDKSEFISCVIDSVDLDHAIRRYEKKSESRNYEFEEFFKDIVAFKNKRDPEQQLPNGTSFMRAQAEHLYGTLSRSMYQIVQESGMSMGGFARRFYIPEVVLEAWCDGTSPCPIYAKLQIAELLGIYSRASTVLSSGVEILI